MTSTFTLRPYVVSFDYGDGPGLRTVTVDGIATAIEHAAYSGDGDEGERYFTMVGDAMTEVEWRVLESYADEDDYLYTRYAMYPKGQPDADTLDVFTVRIDGRA